MLKDWMEEGCGLKGRQNHSCRPSNKKRWQFQMSDNIIEIQFVSIMFIFLYFCFDYKSIEQIKGESRSVFFCKCNQSIGKGHITFVAVNWTRTVLPKTWLMKFSFALLKWEKDLLFRKHFLHQWQISVWKFPRDFI